MKHRRTHNRPAHVLLDQAAFSHNLGRARDLAPNAKIMAVIKADGYGHGMEFSANALSAADEFGVSSLDDVQRLRSQGFKQALTLLSASLTKSEFEFLATLNARPTIYDWQQIKILEKIKPEKELSIWLKVDTGMGRLGFTHEHIPNVLETLKQLASIGDISVMSHLANADKPSDPANQNQLDSFAAVEQSFAFQQGSILNSAGTICFSDAAKDVIRPGLMLYGISPIVDKTSSELQLEPVMTFRSELISVKQLPQGSCIGYGSTHQLASDASVGIVACGYGDGYPRHAPSGTPVVVSGQVVPLIGRVSMDMIAVDLTNISASVGDVVTLWGKENPIETIAKMAATIPYELCCGITQRVERIII